MSTMLPRMARHFLIRVAYLGTNFAGWWWQPDTVTVAGTLHEALVRLGEDCLPQGVSRTDTGVHARDQVAQLTCQRDWQAKALRSALNAQLPDTVVVSSCRPMEAGLVVKDLVISKTYTYRLTTPPGNPLLSPTTYRCPWSLDPQLLDECAQILRGSHNAQAFARSTDHREQHRLTISESAWVHDQGAHTYTITADRFTYHLVRSFVAAQCLVARGAADIGEFTSALQSSEPCPVSSGAVPAQGLCLERVTLEGEDKVKPCN